MAVAKPSSPKPMRMAELLAKLKDYLAAHASPTPRLDAELLLAHVLARPRIYLYAHYDQPISESERHQLRALAVRRAKHEPMAYILGQQEFFGHTFKVDPRVLIPRPETEHLVEAAIAHLRGDAAGAPGEGACAPAADAATPAGATRWLLDLGTGSGAVAIAVALAVPEVRVVAIDISEDALAVARDNAAALGVADRICFVQADFTKLAARDPLWPAAQGGLELPKGKGFDVIASNPPYIGEQERAGLQRSVVDFEPALALFAADAGHALLASIAASAPYWLCARGLLAMELAPQQAAAIAKACATWADTSIVRDLAGHERICLARLRKVEP